MRITIVGAGAIGGTLGAYLSRAGRDVTLVDRDVAHVAAINERGLRMTGIEEFTVPVHAITPEDLHGPLETVLLAVKAQDTSPAVRSLLPHLTAESCVVSFQNGLNEETIAELIGPERTVGCFVNFSADYLEPGVITYAGREEVYLGEMDGRISPRLEALREVLESWGPVHLTENIMGYLWGKEAYGSMLFATALADETMADVIDRYRPLMVELASEVFAVAQAVGVQVEAIDGVDPAMYLPPERRDAAALHRSFDALVAVRRANLKQKSGIWRDLAVRKRKTELDSELQVVALAERHGVPVPLTRRLIESIRDLEEGRRSMSWDNLEELDSLRRRLDLPHSL